MGLFDKTQVRYPNQYPFTEDVMEAIIESPWSHSEFNFRADYGQFKSEMTKEEQDIIVKTLALIGQVEIAVKTFWRDLGNTFPHPHIVDLGCVMAYNEVVHNRAYEHLLNVLGLEHIFEDILKEPVVAGRVDYLQKHKEKNFQDERKQFIYSLILFSLFVENVSLFSQFYIVMHFNKTRYLLKDTAQQIQYTNREENLHATVGKVLINTLRNEYPEYFDEELNSIVRKECLDALKHESRIVRWILGDYDEKDLNSEVVISYIMNRLNKSLEDIGFETLFEVDPRLKEKFMWMDIEEEGTVLTDFFQKRTTEYVKNSKSYSLDDLWGTYD